MAYFICNECSAMSAAYLGYSFDVHGRGVDLMFPHHENEIAQSCAACNQSNISYWIHNGFVTVDSENVQIPWKLLYNSAGYRPLPSRLLGIFFYKTMAAHNVDFVSLAFSDSVAEDYHLQNQMLFLSDKGI